MGYTEWSVMVVHTEANILALKAEGLMHSHGRSYEVSILLTTRQTVHTWRLEMNKSN